MARRPCLDCGRLTERRPARCETCSTRRERERGSSSARGYGHAYRVRRDEVVAEATHCVTCGQPFTEDNPGTGGHTGVPLRAIERAERRASARAAEVEAQCRQCNYGWSR